MSDEDVLFTRSGTSNPGGKLTARLDVPVSEQLESAVITMANLLGMSKSEFARLVLERALFGEFNLMRRNVGAASSLGRWEQSRDPAGEPR